MHSEPTVASPAGKGGVPVLSPALELAERWAREKGDEVGRATGVFGNGPPEAVLRLHHGPAPIVLRDLGGCLQVMGSLQLPEGFRASLKEMDEDGRQELLSALREELMSCPRVGFMLGPESAAGLTDLDRVVVDSVLRLGADDAQTFNRFADAIQETETVLLRVADLIGTFGTSYHRQRAYSSSTPPPADLYL